MFYRLHSKTPKWQHEADGPRAPLTRPEGDTNNQTGPGHIYTDTHTGCHSDGENCETVRKDDHLRPVCLGRGC